MRKAGAETETRRLGSDWNQRPFVDWLVSPPPAVMRLLWVLLVVPALALVALALPGRYTELQALAHRAVPTQLFSASLLAAYPGAALAVEVVVILMFTIISMIVLWRRSVDGMALFVALGLVTYITCVTPPLDVLAGHPLWGIPASIFEGLGLVMTVAFLLVFPDGRFVPGWTRGLLVLYTIIVIVDLSLPAHPFGLANVYTLPPLGAVPQQVALGLGVVAQIYRFRHTPDLIKRQQTKWLLFGMTIAMIGGASYNLMRALVEAIGPAHPAGTAFVLFGIPFFLISLIPIPLAFAISMLRYRLWDVDSLISRTLAYGLLTAMLVLIYFGSVVVLQQLVRQLTGQSSDLAIVVATLASAALFQPLRHRIQTQIDRRFYRRRYDMSQTLAAFSGAVRDEVDLGRLATGLVTVIHETLEPAHLSLWLRPAPGLSSRPDRVDQFLAEVGGYEPGRVVRAEAGGNQGLASPSSGRP